MGSGRARSRAPRELADVPRAWPHADLTGHLPAAHVQAIAATLAVVLAERGLSLRGLATSSEPRRTDMTFDDKRHGGGGPRD